MYLSDYSCDFTSIVNNTIYRTDCDYEKFGTLTYDISLNIYWKSYEIEEDYTITYDVTILDKDELTSNWEILLSCLIICTILIYVIAILIYLKISNII